MGLLPSLGLSLPERSEFCRPLSSFGSGKIRVEIIIGSESDFYVMEDTCQILRDLNIRYDVNIISSARRVEDVRNYALSAYRRGCRVIIAGAGGVANLAGAFAAVATVPVIAVPLDTSPLHGLDSFLSNFQMPTGVPVAIMGIGRSGAKNAAILAAEILALQDGDLEKRLRKLKQQIIEERQLAGQKGRPESYRLV